MFSKEEKKQLIINFWNGFSMYCSRMPFLPKDEKNWLLHRTKVPNVHLKFDLLRNKVLVALEILHRDEAKRLDQFEKIEKYKIILEEGFENGLTWDYAYFRDSGQEVCRIYAYVEGLDYHKQSQWEDIYTFMAENMFRLQTNFIEIRDLIH